MKRIDKSYIQFMIIYEGRGIMAKLKKTPKQFRLDFDCIAFLETIAEKRGVTETEIVQLAVRELAKSELTIEERNVVVSEKLNHVLNPIKE